MSRYQIRIAILIMLLVGTTNYANASPASVAGALGAAAANSAGKGTAEHCYAKPAITTKDGIKIGPTVVCIGQ